MSNVQKNISLEHLQFYHASIHGTPLRTLTKAIGTGYLKSWVVLTLSSIKKSTEPDFNQFGHLHHIRKNI